MAKEKAFGINIEEATAPPTDDFSYLPPEEETYEDFTSLSDPETRKALEAKMIQTFLKVMEASTSTSTNRLAAAKEIGELLGKYAQASTQPQITGENVQVNIADNPEKAKHLLESLRNARSVATGTDSGTRPVKGGQGA